MEFGYCRISTKKQSMERQVRNILKVYPQAKIYEEEFTGTRIDGRRVFTKLLKEVQPGDTIIFDSVSRMSRNAEEGIELYLKLYEQGVRLVFLKEGYINTDTYQEALKSRIELTGSDEDIILEAVNRYLVKLAERQIRIAFEQSEKEVHDLHIRTKEGLVTAKRHGKQIGGVSGRKLHIKKTEPAKEFILKRNKSFGGTLTNEETWKLAGISKMTFYKYKKELMEERKGGRVS